MAAPAGADFFAIVFNAIDGPIAAATTEITGRVLTYVAAAMAGVTSLFIIVFAIACIFLSMTWQRAGGSIIKLLIVLAILTPALFNQYVTEMFTAILPNAVAETIGVGTGPDAAIQGFDTMHMAVEARGEALKAQITGVFYIPERIDLDMAMAGAEAMLIGNFIVVILAMETVRLLIPVGAFILPFLLFENTRHFADRWIGKMVALIIVLMLSLILAAVMFKAFNIYMDAAGMPASNIDGHSANIDEAIQLMWNIAGVFAVGFFLLLIATGIGLYIGGASGFTIAPVVAGMMAIASMGLGAIRVAAANGVRGLGRA